MRRRGALLAAVVCLLVAAPLSAGPAAVPPASEPSPAEPRTAATEPPRNVASQEVQVTLELAPETRELSHDAFTVERVYTRENERVAVGSVELSAVGSLSASPDVRTVRITGGLPSLNTSVASGVATVGADRVNATGDNVTVGIIDGDFRVSNTEVTGSVGAYRSFGDGGDWRHGTAVASVVTDTAPNATLYLAAIGPSTTPDEYAEAVAWLRDAGADVIVDAGSYHAQPGDGSGEISGVVAEAAEGVVFVTSVGNHAGRHWDGTHTAGEWVSFRPGVQGNRLAGGEPVSGRVTVAARWDGWPETSTDYDLYLYRETPGEDAVVARATGHDGRPFERLSTTVPRGRYYVAAHLASGEPGSEVELFADRRLAVATAGGLSPPATAPGVVAVGATRNGSVRPFSAPHADLVAPDTVAVEGVSTPGGTSFAAPYVAGTAALALSERPELSPAQVRVLLRRTADDNESLGLGAGAGRVNATTMLTAVSADGTVALVGPGGDGERDGREQRDPAPPSPPGAGRPFSTPAGPADG